MCPFQCSDSELNADCKRGFKYATPAMNHSALKKCFHCQAVKCLLAINIDSWRLSLVGQLWRAYNFLNETNHNRDLHRA